jgi:hypothetical protein
MLNLSERIAAVRASKDSSLGVTEDEARSLMDEIIESDRDDADAMIAYDLLADRAVFGRAF